MLIGVPKEIKNNEFRVGLTPAFRRGAHASRPLACWSRPARASGPGCRTTNIAAAGATIARTRRGDFRRGRHDRQGEGATGRRTQEAPRPGQMLFTYLHLAPDLRADRDLIESGATCIAYETVTSPSGGLPLLTPMSEVAGRLAPQVGAHALEKAAGGRGVLLGGVPGVPAAEVVILGGGVSGTNAATIASAWAPMSLLSTGRTTC